MSDDLEAEAATWVPPWQRPVVRPDQDERDQPEPDAAAAESEIVPESGALREAGTTVAEAQPAPEEAAPVAAQTQPDRVVLPQQWAGLGRVRWHPAADDDPDAGVEPRDEDEPQDEDEPRETESEPVVTAQEPTVTEVAEEAARPETVLGVPPPGLAEAEIVPALEAILMVVDEPVGEITLAQVLDLTAEQVANALIDLSATYTREGRGFDLRRAAGGWRFYTRAEYSPYVERFVLDGQQLRLTQASLETLAVVAYKQPVTRSRISAIRGVNCDGVIRTLVTRGMIEECGADPDSGAHLYRTTTLFLEKLGLDSVEQLPPLAPFLPDNLDEVANG